MRSLRVLGFALTGWLSASAQEAGKVEVKEPAAVVQEETLTLRMEDAQGRPAGKRGTVEVDGVSYTIGLPKSRKYSVTNTGKGDHGFANTSTALTVGPGGDPKTPPDGEWFANLPIRLGDRMFDVVEIAADGSRVVLKPSKAALRGAVIGRACPPFAFKTADGAAVSLESLAGKPFILDIWSVT